MPCAVYLASVALLASARLKPTALTARAQERLKEALEVNQGAARRTEIDREDWAEWLFGICRPNGRLGKRGSR